MNNYPYGEEIKNFPELILRGIKFTYFYEIVVRNKLFELFDGNFGWILLHLESGEEFDIFRYDLKFKLLVFVCLSKIDLIIRLHSKLNLWSLRDNIILFVVPKLLEFNLRELFVDSVVSL